MTGKCNLDRTAQKPKKEPEVEPVKPLKPEVPLPEITPEQQPNKPEPYTEPEVPPLPEPEIKPEKTGWFR